MISLTATHRCLPRMVISSSKSGPRIMGKKQPVRMSSTMVLIGSSPIYSLILGTKVMIVLSSDQAIKDLLDKRSGIYSSRPEMYIGQIVSGGLRVLLMVCDISGPEQMTHSKAADSAGLKPSPVD